MSGGKQVLLAEPQSLCADVRRAIAIIDLALEQHGAPIYVRKEIVHNHYVVREFERRGVRHADHEEVEGTYGHAPDQTVIVETVADAEALDLPPDAPVAYLTQTTLSVDETREIRMVEVARRAGGRAELVPDVTHFDPAWLAGVVTVSVSAPEILVDQLLDRLAEPGYADTSVERVATEDIVFSPPTRLTGVADVP